MSSVSARPPLLETVETVEAPQPPGRMAARQRAKDAAFPRRSRGERAFPHGKGLERFSEFRTQPQVFTQSVWLAISAKPYRALALYSSYSNQY